MQKMLFEEAKTLLFLDDQLFILHKDYTIRILEEHEGEWKVVQIIPFKQEALLQLFSSPEISFNDRKQLILTRDSRGKEPINALEKKNGQWEEFDPKQLDPSVGPLSRNYFISNSMETLPPLIFGYLHLCAIRADNSIVNFFAFQSEIHKYTQFATISYTPSFHENWHYLYASGRLFTIEGRNLKVWGPALSAHKK